MELRKYDALKKGIAENLAMQARLLGLIGSQQGVYKSTFAIAEWRRSCEVRSKPYMSQALIEMLCSSSRCPLG